MGQNKLVLIIQHVSKRLHTFSSNLKAHLLRFDLDFHLKGNNDLQD
jgi:hypothetical protein